MGDRGICWLAWGIAKMAKWTGHFELRSVGEGGMIGFRCGICSARFGNWVEMKKMGVGLDLFRYKDDGCRWDM